MNVFLAFGPQTKYSMTHGDRSVCACTCRALQRLVYRSNRTITSMGLPCKFAYLKLRTYTYRGQ